MNTIFIIIICVIAIAILFGIMKMLEIKNKPAPVRYRFHIKYRLHWSCNRYTDYDDSYEAFVPSGQEHIDGYFKKLYGNSTSLLRYHTVHKTNIFDTVEQTTVPIEILEQTKEKIEDGKQ